MGTCTQLAKWSHSRIVQWCVPVLLLVAVLTSRGLAQADNAPAAAPTQAPQSSPAQPTHTQETPVNPAKPIPRRTTIDDRVKAFATALDLSDGQKVAVKRILEQRQIEILRLRQDPSLSGSDRMARLRLLQDQTVERIRAVLNDEQKKKYNPLAVRERQPSADQKSVEEWLKTTTPK